MKTLKISYKALAVLGVMVIGLISCNFHGDILDSVPAEDDEIRFYTEMSGGHQHVVDIPEIDFIEAPDSAYYDTSVVGHYHTLTISGYEFELLSEGYSVQTQTSTVNGHYHDVILEYSN